MLASYTTTAISETVILVVTTFCLPDMETAAMDPT